MAKDCPKFYDTGRQVDTFYSPGDLVWLSRKHINSRRPSQMLDYRRIGPFCGICMIEKMLFNYSFQNSFHTFIQFLMFLLFLFFLPSQTFSSKEPTNLLTAAEAIQYLTNWVANTHILGHQITNKRHDYLLRGEGSTSDDNDVWMALSDISCGLDPFIQEFHQIHWQDHRPNWALFDSTDRPQLGFTAKNI